LPSRYSERFRITPALRRRCPLLGAMRLDFILNGCRNPAARRSLDYPIILCARKARPMQGTRTVPGCRSRICATVGCQLSKSWSTRTMRNAGMRKTAGATDDAAQRGADCLRTFAASCSNRPIAASASIHRARSLAGSMSRLAAHAQHDFWLLYKQTARAAGLNLGQVASERREPLAWCPLRLRDARNLHAEE